MSLKRLLYTLFLYFIFPLVLSRLLFRSLQNSEYRKRWSERLGFVHNTDKNSVIWLHAVSVGEAIAAKPLIESLINNYPDISILVSTTTPTGSDRVKAMFFEEIQSNRLQHVYFPYDLLGTVSRYIKAFQPKILIVMETEIWPNLYAKCKKNQIPIVLVNARLSEKSTQSYLRIKGLVAETLSNINVIAVRSKIDAERFIQLGAKQHQIKETGNIKYDISIDESQVAKAVKYAGFLTKKNQKKRLVFVCASTHEGEDQKLMTVYQALLKQFPDLLLVLVPRHPERFDQVYQDCVEQLPQSLNIIKHSQNVIEGGSDIQTPNVIIGDSMGEMQMWYAFADIVFIGGSLVETGGHNPLEATIFCVPVVSGPHMFNFEDIATELSSTELLTICNDEFEVSETVFGILTDLNSIEKQSSLIKSYKNKSDNFMQQHQGVTARLSLVISNLLK